MEQELDKCVLCGRTLHGESALCPGCQQDRIEAMAKRSAGVWVRNTFDLCVPRLKAETGRRLHRA